MTTNSKPDEKPWTDPDDAPEWTEEMFRRAEIRQGDKILRPASGTIAKAGRPYAENPKKQVTLRLDAAVLDAFRSTGPGWQSRINAELRKVLGL